MKTTSEEKCPLCNSFMEQWHDTLDGWCLMEDYLGCPNGCYSYYYHTGTTEITVKSKEFTYYHTATQEEKDRVQKSADEYLKSLQQEAAATDTK